MDRRPRLKGRRTHWDGQFAALPYCVFKSSEYAIYACPDFPRAVRIGPRAGAWRESEIRAWINSRVETPRATKSAASTQPAHEDSREEDAHSTKRTPPPKSADATGSKSGTSRRKAKSPSTTGVAK